MRWSVVRGAVGIAVLATATPGGAQSQDRVNALIPLIEQGLPIFGVSHPAYAAGRGGGAGGGRAGGAAGEAAPEPPPQPDLVAVARETVAYTLGDYELNTYAPATVDRYRAYMRALIAAGGSARTHPFVAKIPIWNRDPAAAAQRIAEQLNDGQVVLEMQEVESVADVNAVISAMRFTSKGGTRPESGYGLAADYWGLTEAQYREKADVWPLNPNGELLLSVIIESREGAANARAIAAVPGVSIVTVGTGTLGGVFTSTNAAGERVRDQAGFEAAVASILAACKEFKKSCGIPANNPEQVEALMADGWDFLIMQRRDQAAFDAVVTGRRLSGRPLTP